MDKIVVKASVDPRPGMRVLVAPNAFKGSLTATQVARAMAKGVRRWGGAPTQNPLADGGDGTLDVLRKPLGLGVRPSKALDPLGRVISARWGYNSKTLWAVVEMAQSSGLALLKRDERRPLATTSFGTGQLIRTAVRAGAKVVFVGLGGSATVDGGLGILQALGARISIRRSGGIELLDRPATGKDLTKLHDVDVNPLARTLKGVRLRVLCDVSNLLLGSRGAARAFGPQKGATLSEVRQLEGGLKRLAMLMRSHGRDVRTLRGAGAAGGAAAGVWAFARATLERGTQRIFQLIDLEKEVKRADMVLTGEGWVDRTSWEGKGVGELARLCRRYKKPLIVLTGGIGPGGCWPGVRVIPIGTKKMSEKEKMRRVAALIENKTAQL